MGSFFKSVVKIAAPVIGFAVGGPAGAALAMGATSMMSKPKAQQSQQQQAATVQTQRQETASRAASSGSIDAAASARQSSLTGGNVREQLEQTGRARKRALGA